MPVRVKDTDNGYKAMRRNLFGPGTQVLVGITEEVGNMPHGASGKDAVTILMIAIWNEFGTSTNTPERSFLRSWFDANKPKAEKWLLALMPSLLSGKRTKQQVLDILGLKIVGEIQKNMTKGIPPPNAPSTIAKKGSDVTLIDTGVLRSKITHVVKQGKDQ